MVPFPAGVAVSGIRKQSEQVMRKEVSKHHSSVSSTPGSVPGLTSLSDDY